MFRCVGSLLGFKLLAALFGAIGSCSVVLRLLFGLGNGLVVLSRQLLLGGAVRADLGCGDLHPPFARSAHHVLALYRVLFVFFLLFLVVFSAVVHRCGMKGIFVGRVDMLLVASRGLYPFESHCADRLFALFCPPSALRWRVFHIAALRGRPRLCSSVFSYCFAGVVDRVRFARIGAGRLVFVVFCVVPCVPFLLGVFVGSIVPFLFALFRRVECGWKLFVAIWAAYRGMAVFAVSVSRREVGP